ncbi:uncharacterized protein LOC105423004 [Pogonomyrmex barbatus]|uniref:Uncharacterized protein LOC105423004 n=1 Tax=Pogonomyrmex barbatus TaxID=144034 RepID=A0A6I9WGU2_9HYME|nr:uncharacterized protein LOC105423004 [Pogonomyrmex barbatus]
MKKKQITSIAKFVLECSKTLLSIMFRLGYFADKRLLNIVKEYITGAMAGVGEDDAGGPRGNIAVIHPYQLRGLRRPTEDEAEGVNEQRVRMRIDVQPEEEGISTVDLVSDAEENIDEESTLSEADTEIYTPLQANDLDESEYGEEENEEENEEE